MITPAPATTHKIVMLVDDNEIDNYINEKIIKGSCFSDIVYVNTSSTSAIEFLRNLSFNKELRKDHLPSVLFLDINMPILDGFQFLEEFEKLDEDIKSFVKVAILTSSIDPADLERSHKYGAVCRFLNKPLTEESLKTL
jgi:CheY-like chemotaxis protein